jgi:hypothetical protein
MRYLVTARVKPGRRAALDRAIDDGSLGRGYWEQYFDLEQIKDAHDRRRCRHENGEETWACSTCDCTRKLETWLVRQGRPFTPSAD